MQSESKAMSCNDEEIVHESHTRHYSHGHMFVKSMHINFSLGSHDAIVSMIFQAVFQIVTSWKGLLCHVRH